MTFSNRQPIICNFLSSGYSTHVPPISINDSVDIKPIGRRSPILANSRGSSSSSLSSLSQLDEAVAFAERQLEEENRRENQFKSQPVRFAGSGQTGSKGDNSKATGYNNVTREKTNAERAGRKDSKAVKFGLMDVDYDDAISAAPSSRKMDIVVAAKKSSNGSIVNGRANVGNERGRSDKSDLSTKRNGTEISMPSRPPVVSPMRENGNHMNGSVTVSAYTQNPHVQNARKPAYTHTQDAHNGRLSPVSVLVNGSEVSNSLPSPCGRSSNENEFGYATRIIKDSTGYKNDSNEISTNDFPHPPPLSTLPKKTQQTEKRAQRPDTINIRPAPPPANPLGSKPEFLSDIYVADDIQTGSQVVSTGSPAPPPPPPPPPPPVSVVNGNLPKKNMEEIKKKTTSLPARFVFFCSLVHQNQLHLRKKSRVDNILTFHFRSLK